MTSACFGTKASRAVFLKEKRLVVSWDFHTISIIMYAVSSVTWCFSKCSPRRGSSSSLSGETALSTRHVGVGSLWPQALHWQKAGTQGLCAHSPTESEVQRTDTQPDGHKVCDASGQVSGLAPLRKLFKICAITTHINQSKKPKKLHMTDAYSFLTDIFIAFCIKLE